MQWINVAGVGAGGGGGLFQTEINSFFLRLRLTSIMKEQCTSGHDEDHSVILLMIMWLHYVQHETECYSEVASQLSVGQEPTVSKPHQSFMLSLTVALVQLFSRRSFSWTENSI